LQLFANSFLAALENARITKDRFIDEVTKQLRIPLTELHTSIEQIEQQHAGLPEQERGLMIKQAYKASEDLSMLLNTIFTVSAPRKDIRLEALELSPFIHAIIEDLDDADQRIAADIPEGTFISTDIFLFHQICASILKQMLTYPHQTMKIYTSHTYVHVYLSMECLESRGENETHITFSQALIKSLLQEIHATLEVTITDTGHERITIGLPKAQAQDDES
jgi:K+-sensing histidine kinase KdpD